MNMKRFLISVLVAFIFVFVYEWMVHGILLKGIYEATSHLWRPEEGNAKYMIFLFASQFWFVLMIAFIFTRNYEGKGIKEGLRYGLYMGLLLASIQLGTYCYLPIPITLTLAWMVAAALEGIGIGAVLSLTYKS